MIQLNNVSFATSNTGSGAVKLATDPAALDSFENALSEAVSQTLQKFGINPNSVNISIAPAATPASTDTPAAAGHSTNSSPAPTPASVSSLAPFMGNSSSSNAASTPSASSTPQPQSPTPAIDPVRSFNETYWAKQPSAVQQLQSIEDPGERSLMASQLASEGYKIDVPIMAWGWDPSQVTSLRQSYGYTWVPSALQNPIAVAPGLSVPGMQDYDPNNAPAGSIAV